MWLFAIIVLFIFLIVINTGKIKHTPNPTYPKRYSDIEFFHNGKHLYDQMFKDIQEAKKFVCITFFIIKSDPFSEKFFKCLSYASERGVKVYLLADRIGSIKLKRGDIKDLKKAGVHFSYSHKLRIPLFSSINHRNHRKIAIIDGKIGYVGGFNMGDEYVNDHRKFSLWRDYHVRFMGGAVVDLLDVFKRDWQEHAEEPFPHYVDLEKGASLCQIVPSKYGSIEKTFLELINDAKNSIAIGTPYFIPSETILNLLEEKIKERVHVTILYPHESDHPLVKEASIPFLKRMSDAGAEVMLYTNGFYHAKALIIDDRTADIGTANFDRRSLYINEEVNLIIYDPKVVQHIYSFYEKDLNDAMPLYDDWLKQPRPYLMGVKKFLAKLIHPLL